MKKNSFFFRFFTFFLFISSSLPLNAQDLHGKDLSEFIYSRIGNNSEKQFLVSSGANDFPYNVIAHIHSSKEFNKKIIFAFKAEDFESHELFFVELSKALKKTKKHCNIDMIWTIGDYEHWDDQTYTSGIATYISKIKETNGLCAVNIKFIEDRAKIIPGSGGDVSPSWLLKLASDSFYKSKLPYNIKGGVISSLYRINALVEDASTGLFIQERIPSIGIELNNQDFEKSEEKWQKEIQALCSLAENYNPEQSEYWDRHTNQLSIGPRTFWLDEKFTVISFSIIIFLSLFIICEFSFAFKRQKINFVEGFKSLWYFIPLCAIVTFLCFLAGQFVSMAIVRNFRINPFSAISIKLFVAFFLYSSASLVFIYFEKNISDRVYSFLQLISALLNIFIFSTIDISLFYLFAIEYILVNISRYSKKLIYLELSFLMMLVPFVPYGYQIVLYAKPQAIIAFLSVTPKFNVFFALGFLPFILMWMRILARINEKNSKSHSKKRWIVQNVLALFCVSMVFAITLVFFSMSVPHRYRTGNVRQHHANEIIDEENLINISFNDSVFFGETTRSLQIDLERECINCSVILSGTKRLPVLYSQWDYKSDINSLTNYFQLPVYPSRKMRFNYISSNETDTTVKVRCRFQNEADKIYVKEYLIPMNKGKR